MKVVFRQYTFKVNVFSTQHWQINEYHFYFNHKPYYILLHLCLKQEEKSKRGQKNQLFLIVFHIVPQMILHLTGKQNKTKYLITRVCAFLSAMHFCNIIWDLDIKTIHLRLTQCTSWPYALFDLVCGWDSIKIGIYICICSQDPLRVDITPKILCNQTMVVQSESNEKNKSLKLILHYLLLKDLVKPAWNLT